ncbi:hypothetical protein [Actinomadura decatromicini]|uniref:Uncharacterized protein n=1 Tax=Actinomadura decatromicini TaxID=2604572 RepID=A0A5D3F6W5_9ACTN|nr:hypothetical protein [Actinomadura decatromicini]TYK43634.1 hypothetical protein FXF68_36380 [Actinomadura decatromicini]
MSEETRTVEVTVLVGRHPGTGNCVIGDGVAAVELPGMDGPRVVPADVVPEWIAALVALAPRPRAKTSGMLVTSQTGLDVLLGDCREPDISRDWLDLLATIRASLIARWRVTAAPGGDIEILDCASAGLWAVQPCPPEAVGAANGPLISLTPTTPTAVWTWLSLLASPTFQGETHGLSP